MPITNLAIERRNLKELKQMFVHYDNISVEPSYDGSYEDFKIYGKKVFDTGIFVLLGIHGWKILSVTTEEISIFKSLESKVREANIILVMNVTKKRREIS